MPRLMPRMKNRTLTESELDALLDALYRMRDGDFTVRLSPRGATRFSEVARVLNEVFDQCEQLSNEVQRVSETVSTDGRLSERVSISPARGSWGQSVRALNQMLDEVSEPVTAVARILDSVANGDLSQRVDLASRHGELHGDLLRLATSVNRMADQMSEFAGEVTRVAREVGTEGKLGGRANVKGVSGIWKDLTDNVNSMADNLTNQVRDISQVTTAVARGDLTKKVTVDVQGEMLQLKDTVNTMVDQLSTFADEVTRVAREVGTEGKLGGRANVKGVSGIWKDLTDNVNSMADNLTNQVRDISQVTTAVARGDLTKKVTVDVQGEMLQLKDTVNTMVDQLSTFADEVTRVAREVGTEGKLGGRANVKGVSGIWKDLTDNVNSMADSLTHQVRNISQVTSAVAAGDLTKKITVDAQGEILELKDTVNTMVDQLSAFADEVTRVAREVGTEGKLGGQAHVSGVSGVWKDLTDNVNSMANNLTHQVRQISVVTTAVARGDLTKKVTVNAKGEILELKDTINTMVDQLSPSPTKSPGDARSRHRRQARRPRQRQRRLRHLERPHRQRQLHVAQPDHSGAQHLPGGRRRWPAATSPSDHRGRPRRDAGVEGHHQHDGRPAVHVRRWRSRGSATKWVLRASSASKRRWPACRGCGRTSPTTVNELAKNLTTQVRAIASVASAVARGDLTQSIQVSARGELATLKDNVNLMVSNLRETTAAQRDEDWLKSNLARLSGLLQGRRDLNELARLIMTEVTPLVDAQHGACYLPEDENDTETFRLYAGYGYQPSEERRRITAGQGLAGEAIAQRKELIVHDVPATMCGSSQDWARRPVSLAIFPIVSEDRVLGVIELGSYGTFREIHLNFLRQLVSLLSATITTILANSKTEYLLAQSQQLTTALQERSNELQRQQEELRRKNAELHSKAGQLASQNRAIELQNRQIERARRSLEDRAHQLQVSSKYKSEFLANMSHELRTPLNSLLILARLLADNSEKNLTPKQVEFAQTIYKAGSDLLQLINEILDLSKVEAGRMELNPSHVSISQLVDYVEASFRPLASEKGLAFAVEVSPDVPDQLWTDEQRLQQVLRNLLSNAVKFTSSGEVRLVIEPAWAVEDIDVDTFTDPDEVIAFSVIDTGIGIPEDKLQLIFEAFHQGDGGTSRRFGGTGLGLSISRNMAELLGGEIRVSSTVGEGSTFTLLLPVRLPEGTSERMYRSLSDADVVTSFDRPTDTVVLPTETPGPKAADTDPLASSEDEPYVPVLTAESVPQAAGGPQQDDVLAGKRVLIVDDDIRNVFALASALEAHGLEVLYADNGREGIAKLEANEDIDLVLMDIMMPELDGDATTRMIREMPQFADLPIISLTAKAMRGDRENSLAAGASDYVSKPVDLDHLLNVMRRWLDRGKSDNSTSREQ